MKLAGRWVVDRLAALSLLLAAALIAVWVSRLLPRQLWIPLSFQVIDNPRHSLSAGGATNILFFESIQYSAPVAGPKYSDPTAPAFRKKFASPEFHVTAFRFKTIKEPHFNIRKDGRLNMDGTRKTIGVPYGFLLALFLLLPAWRWVPVLARAIRRRFAALPGACRICGYDLRATPTQCPECGTVVLAGP